MSAGTLTVAKVFANVRELLGDKDPGGLIWLDSELFGWLNEGALEIIRLRPEASSVTDSHVMASGTQQNLPADGMALLNIEYNGTSASPGRVCRLVDRRQLDANIPDWHTQAKKKEIVWVMVSESNPNLFWVYPPNDGTGTLTYTYAKYPTVVASTSDLIPVPDTYLAPLVDYICFRAYLKQLESKESQARAAEHRQLFDNAMGMTNAMMMQRTAVSRIQPSPNLGAHPVLPPSPVMQQ